MALSSLDFHPGLDFQATVHDRFGSLAFVTSPPYVRDFFLVVSFSRSAIRLDENSVALILQSVLGRNASDFRLLHQSSWIFQFSVSSKNIGVMVRRLDKFIFKYLALFFSRWRDGGPDFIKEKKKWDLEQQAEWHTVSRSSKRSSANVAAMPPAPNAHHSRNVFKRLSYPNSYFHDNFEKDDAPVG